MKTVGRCRILYKQEIEIWNKEYSDKKVTVRTGLRTSKSPAVSFYLWIFIYITEVNRKEPWIQLKIFKESCGFILFVDLYLHNRSKPKELEYNWKYLKSPAVSFYYVSLFT